jgi:DNA polymerase-3 subunit delta'
MLLPTLISRCQHTNIPPIESDDLKSTIASEIKDKEKLTSQAEGDLNRLLGLLQKTNNKEHEALLIQGLRTAFKAKGNKGVVIDLMQWSGELGILGREDQKAFLSYGIQFFRDALLLNYSLTNLVHYRSENNFDLKKLAPFVNSKNIQNLISLFETSHYHILRNANAKMVFAELGLQLTRLLNKSSS